MSNTGNYLGQRYSTALVIPDNSNVDDKKTFDELNYVFNALRTLALSLDSLTGALSPLQSNWPTVDPQSSILGNNINKFYALCSENIAYGSFVNFFNKDSLSVYARNAQASSAAKGAWGFCVTAGGFTAGNWGEFVVGPGVNYALSGMVPGTIYYLDPNSTSGQINSAAPTVAGQIKQVAGIAITDKKLLVPHLGTWIQL